MKYRLYLNDKHEPRFLRNGDYLISADGIIFERYGYSKEFVVCDYQEEIVIQMSTGLKDKNGVEIFEGDLVKVVKIRDGNTMYLTSKDSLGCVLEVVWCERYKCFDVKELHEDAEGASIGNYRHKGMLEVIGNIFENKELL